MLAKRSLEKEDKSNIITLGSIAKELKKKDPSIINSTIGMLYDEDSKLFVFKSVDEALKNLSSDEKYAYAPTEGTRDFSTAIKKWVFKDYYDKYKELSEVVATPGGSGALSNSFSNYLNEGDKALLPSYMWGNYKQMLYENNQGYTTYELFNSNGGFNLEDLKAKALELKHTQDNILILLNDPCENPTGYSLTKEELSSLVDLLNELSSDGTNVILVHDMAYIDYDISDFYVKRDNLNYYDKLNDNVFVIFAFSGSKTFGLYGLRIGAMVGVSKNKEYLEEFKRANKFSARSKWSNSSNLGMNLISKIILDENLRNSYLEEIKYASSLLDKRANLFKKLAEENNLNLSNYKSGFFITIPTNKPWEVYEELVKDKIHIIPMNNCIRVTISSITMEEIKRMVYYIAVAIKKYAI